MTIYFYRPSEDDDEATQSQVLDTASGLHKFFRLSGPAMQERFTEVVDCSTMPKLLLHGNPHVANYCKTSNGAAMVDFDRSRVGPYAYDIVRFLTSVSICGSDDGQFLHPVVVDHFRRGYLYGLFANKRYKHEEMHELRTQEPRRWQMSATDYLESGKKWAKKLFENKVGVSRKRIKMLESYFESRNDNHTLERFCLTTCSTVAGSLGKLHHLYLLEDKKNDLEPIIIDIKEVYAEKDNKWFTNPYSHHGVRMNTAGEIYAPGWEQMPGHATYKEEQYWCRQIPIQQVKLAAPIDPIDQCDLCFAVGAELGRGHSLASDEYNSKDIFKDFKENFNAYFDCAKNMQREVMESHEVYCAELKLRQHGII